MPNPNQNKTNRKTKTERIRMRLEQIKAAARPAAEEIAVAPDATPVKPAAVKAETKDVVKNEFALDGAAKFIWTVDGQQLRGQYRVGDSTLVINDPVTGYISSVPTSLALAVHVTGIGRLTDLEQPDIVIPSKFKLARNGEFVASMAFKMLLPRVAWRVNNRSIVWAIIQYQPSKSAWRVTRLRSTPRQSVYEAQQILRAVMGDNVYTKLKEAVELITAPL